MAKYTQAKCRLCRREGTKLFLKGEKCFKNCPIDKKGAVPPGVHGPKRRRRPSEYSLQLREKQKARRTYGILERQFKKYFDKAKKFKGATGETLLQLLEMRLDNVVFRLNLAPSRSIARQLVSHGHVLVDGKRVNIPSYSVKAGQTVSVSDRGLKIPQVKETFSEKNVIIPKWLEKKAAVGRVKEKPSREQIEGVISEQLIVEYYSR